MTAFATFSRCRIYRYTLRRTWVPSRGTVMFVGLNPSTADETCDDPTIRRCIRFAMDWRYGGIVVTNLFAYRSTDPRRLLAVADPIGPQNDRWLAHFSDRVDLTVVAWGTRGILYDRDAQVLRSIRKPHCLGLTKAGAPRHPLYIRAEDVKGKKRAKPDPPDLIAEKERAIELRREVDEKILGNLLRLNHERARVGP